MEKILEEKYNAWYQLRMLNVGYDIQNMIWWLTKTYKTSQVSKSWRQNLQTTTRDKEEKFPTREKKSGRPYLIHSPHLCTPNAASQCHSQIWQISAFHRMLFELVEKSLGLYFLGTYSLKKIQHYSPRQEKLRARCQLTSNCFAKTMKHITWNRTNHSYFCPSQNGIV